MNYILEKILSSPHQTFIAGMSFMVGFLSVILCLGFYFILRQKALLYFVLATVLGYLGIYTLNFDPSHLLDLHAHPIYFRLLHIIIIAAQIFYFLLLVEIFKPYPPKRTVITLFHTTFYLSIFARLVAIVTMIPATMKVTALFTFFFYMMTIVFGLNFPTKTRSSLLLKIGSSLTSLGISIYPLVRSGLISSLKIIDHIAILQILAISAFAFFLLLGLVELARETKKDLEVSNLKQLSTTLVQLRDLLNTPMQTIEFSTTLLRENPHDIIPILERMQTAVERMRRINNLLAQYEKNIEWKEGSSHALNNIALKLFTDGK